jgi:hypothetical protein
MYALREPQSHPACLGATIVCPVGGMCRISHVVWTESTRLTHDTRRTRRCAHDSLTTGNTRAHSCGINGDSPAPAHERTERGVTVRTLAMRGAYLRVLRG